MPAHCAKAPSNRDTAESSLNGQTVCCSALTHLTLRWGLVTASLVCKGLILYQLDIDLLGASVIAGVVDATRIGQGAEVN